MSDQPKWFTLRGEQYMYDQGQWWRKWEPTTSQIKPDGYQFKAKADSLDIGEWCDGADAFGKVSTLDQKNNVYRVPCSQPFRVGDRVKVVRVTPGSQSEVKKCVGTIGRVEQLRSDVSVYVSTVSGNWYLEPFNLEPAEPSPAYIPPAGWRVKGDDEVVENGDKFSHTVLGALWEPACLIVDTGCEDDDWTGKRSSEVAERFMPRSGYILTPIVEPATQTPDVSQDSADDDMDEWEIYEPVVGERYSPGTQYRHRSALGDDWNNQNCNRVYCTGGYRLVDNQYTYRRPKNPVGQKIIDRLTTHVEQSERKPIDIYLPEIERKVMLAAKDRPELLDWWRGEKERLAIEAVRRMSDV